MQDDPKDISSASLPDPDVEIIADADPDAPVVEGETLEKEMEAEGITVETSEA